MKVLVTGATGFIGNHVINCLLLSGHEIVATATNEAKASNYGWYSRVNFKEYSFAIPDDGTNLFAFFGEPDLLIHLAWQGLPNYKNLFHIEKNLFEQFSFLKNLIQSGLQNIAVSGTCLEYGMQQGCLNEDMLPMPTVSYAVAKDILRKYIDLLKGEYDFNFKWIRLFYIYGDGQNPNSLIPLLDKAITDHDDEFCMSGGEQLRDYLPVETVAKYIVSIATQNEINGVINCCSGMPITVRTLVENYLEKRKSNLRLNLGCYPYTDYEPMSFWGDDQKLKKNIERVINLNDNFSNYKLGDPILYTQTKVPVFQNKVYVTADDALAAVCGEVDLVQSAQSGFIFNRSFDPSIMEYDQNYQNEQGASLIFQEHLSSVLKLLKSFGLNNKKIVEVGCGKGVFFEMMLNEGLDCWGFDPTYEGSNSRITKEYFSEKYNNINADVIVMRHTLEHIPKPFTFIHTIAKANNYSGYLFVEVPTFDWIVNKKAFWDIFYEHCNYFTEQSLKVMFNEAQTGHFFGGQYIYLWANLADVRSTIPFELENTERRDLIFREKIDFYTDFLNKNKSIGIWGAGAKGSTFLNLLDKKGKFVEYVIDINFAKQNRFIGGTGHQIFSPEILKYKPVKNILVMNENYFDEIKLALNDTAIKLFTL